ncbi:UNVERIFIED_ORG: hypothetical protein Xoosp15_8 [Xanthomonas phage Xoo-sp15]
MTNSEKFNGFVNIFVTVIMWVVIAIKTSEGVHVAWYLFLVAIVCSLWTLFGNPVTREIYKKLGSK